MKKLEIACFNLPSALVAIDAKADRIELCDDLQSGGTTPNEEVLRQVRNKATQPVFVMIRPRGGNFVYTDGEFREMKNAILELKPFADGFVFGILTEDDKIDMIKNRELVKLAKPLPCSFHRAFDRVKDSERALEEIIACGFTTVLTSGCLTSAPEGAENLKKLVAQASGRIDIMPGGGVRSKNLKSLDETIGATWYHSAALIEREIASAEEIIALKNLLR